MLDNCLFKGNIAALSAGAAASFFFADSVSINNCVFDSSAVQGFGSSGGAVCFGDVGKSSINNCVFYDNQAQLGPSCLLYFEASPVITNTVFSFSPQGAAIERLDTVSTVSLSCTNIFGNAAGDWVGEIADQQGASGNISFDPLFCDTALGMFSLREGALGLPENNTCGEFIGLEDSICIVTDVGDDEGAILPNEFSLSQNYPNPFNPSTTI